MTPPIRNINGKNVPLNGKKKGGAVVAAAALAGGVAFAGAGAGGGTAADVAGPSLRAKTNSSKAEAKEGRTQQAWAKMGWKQIERKAERAVKCAAYSYGEVQEFFLRTPCESLDQALFTIADGAGNTVLVSIVWVRMANANAAERLKRLADTDGTGDVSPLGAAAVRAGFTGQHYDSDRRGSMTVIAEAASAGGHPDGDTMDAATEIAVVFPPP